MNPTFSRIFARLSLYAWATALFLGAPMTSEAMTSTAGGPLPQPLPLFPADNWWNLDISSWPVDPNSASYIGFINNGGTRKLHPDFGGNAGTSQDPYACYGFPYAVVSGVAASDLAAVQFDYADESDGVNHSTGSSYPFYPIPPAAITQPYWIEGGDPGNVDLRSSQDRHLLIVDGENNYLYELYNVFYSAATGQWLAGSGAFFDMNTNNRRPDGWTSADAAGLAILPGLVRYYEAYDPTGAEIMHAFRVTVRATDGYVYPASHQAGSTAGALPMGARLRLKASVDVTQRSSDVHVQRILRAMQRYGLIVADNGSDMYISGTYDTRWDNNILNPGFGAVTASDFDVILLGYNPSAAPAALAGVTVNPGTVTGGKPATGTVNLTAAAPASGLTVALSSSNPAAVVPASVPVSAGASSANFTVTTSPVSGLQNATVTASYNGVSKSAALSVTPPALSSLSLSPSTVVGGSAATGTVTLTGPAPSQGVVVTLTSSKPSVAAVPASVTVGSANSTATFSLRTTTVTANTSVTITGQYGGAAKSAVLSVTKKKH
jgi:hypothetical protein